MFTILMILDMADSHCSRLRKSYPKFSSFDVINFFWQVHSTFKVKNSGLTCKVRCKRHIQLTTLLWTREFIFSFGLWQYEYQRRSNKHLSSQQIQMINFFRRKYINWVIPISIHFILFRTSKNSFNSYQNLKQYIFYSIERIN